MAHIGNHTQVAWAIVMLPLTATNEAAVKGESVYQEACIACHGAAGEGMMPGAPELSDPKVR